MSGNVNLTKLQEATKAHILEVLERKRRETAEGPVCYLLADEVGLGKTKIAAAVINALATKDSSKPFVVYYICGNQRVTDQNIKKLQEDCGAVETENVRLSMQLGKNYSVCNGKNVVILPLTPATTFTHKNSEFNQREMEYLCLQSHSGRCCPAKCPICSWQDYLKAYNLPETYSDSHCLLKSIRVDKQLLLSDGGKVKWDGTSKEWHAVLGQKQVQTFLSGRANACKKVMAEQLSPSLVLLDEFQNYDGLLYGTYDLFQAMLRQKTYVLMLSATPYQMLTKEIQALHYRDVLTDSADGMDTNIRKQNDEEENDTQFCINNNSFNRLVNFICYPSSPSSDQSYSEDTDLYRDVFCRSERSMFYDTEIKDEPVEENSIAAEDAAGNIEGLKEFAELVLGKGLVKDDSLDRMIAYEKKAPNFPCFSTRYKDIKGNITDAEYCQDKVKESLLHVLASRNPDSQAKYGLLKKYSVTEDIAKVLWIPPVIWKAPEIDGLDFSIDNPFLKNRSYTKTLVFGDYRMSTAAPALYLTKDLLAQQAAVQTAPAKILTHTQKAALEAYYEDCFTPFASWAQADARHFVDNYLDEHIALICAVTGITDGKAAKWYYAAMGCLKQVLEEYSVLNGLNRVSAPGEQEKQSKLLEDLLNYEPSQVIFFPDHGETDSGKKFMCSFAERFTEDKTDTNAHILSHTRQLQARFNSPFYPFVMTASSVAQEGLDFHFYSHAIAHWSIPKTPVEFMQREGRIDRYCSHLVRKRMHMLLPGIESFQDLVEACRTLPETCLKEMDYPEKRPLFPWWYIGEKDFTLLFRSLSQPLPKFRRLVCALPLSSEYVFWKKLQKSLADYNVRLGPSYQAGTKNAQNFCPLLRSKRQ